MKIAITNRWDGLVIFEHDQEENTIAITLAKAAKEKINMREADLRGSDLRGADLRGANLEQANLCCADLQNANLRNADLRNAILCKANLDGVKWYNAKLVGARFGDAYGYDYGLTGEVILLTLVFMMVCSVLSAIIFFSPLKYLIFPN
jgi:uncharacterized protein YjbI with pentapeptide repeats